MKYAVAHASDLYMEYNMRKTILELIWCYKGNQPGLNRTTDASSCLPKTGSAFLTSGKLFSKLVLYPQETWFMMNQPKDHEVSDHCNHVCYPRVAI